MGKFRGPTSPNIPDPAPHNFAPAKPPPPPPPPPPNNTGPQQNAPNQSTNAPNQSTNAPNQTPNSSQLSPNSSQSSPNSSQSSNVDPQQVADPNTASAMASPAPGIPQSHIDPLTGPPTPSEAGAAPPGSWALAQSVSPGGSGAAPRIIHGPAVTGAGANQADPNANQADPHANQAGHHRQRQHNAHDRENAFYKDGSENANPYPVIYNPNVPTSSAGWTNQQFFDNLGNPVHPHGSLHQKAEQEYILQGMPKGALREAADIATKYNIGIAVRPTGVAAHHGIESGMPTKAQEFKNKTSKEMDLWLCDEMTFGDVGAVMHYDPRLGWHSGHPDWDLPRKEPKAKDSKNPTAAEKQAIAEWNAWFDAEWAKKKQFIELVRIPKMRTDIAAGRVKEPKTDDDWGKIKDWFKSRMNEYREEHPEYTSPKGHYVKDVKLVGPFIHLALRPDQHMYGDHDLFGFTNADTNQLEHDSKGNGPAAQKDLQNAETFQAQHGGIWNWDPKEQFHIDIKNKIMGAHSHNPSEPHKDEPLIYILPGNKVIAAFYVEPDKIVPAWDFPNSQWMGSTHSGKQLLKKKSETDGVKNQQFKPR